MKKYKKKIIGFYLKNKDKKMEKKIAYKFKNIKLCEDKNGYNYIQIKLVAKFQDGKYDKFIPLKEAVKFLEKAVIYEDDFDSIRSKGEIEREKKEEYKKQLNRQQGLINNILGEIK